jgi:bifunctional non-homologous end joining protein LigD
MSGFQVQLANSIDVQDIEQYVNDDRYYFEQKLDGHRRVIEVNEGQVTGWSRKGTETDVDRNLAAVLRGINGRWVIDGEWIDGVLYAFDLPIAPGINVQTPYSIRRRSLDLIVPKLTEKTHSIQLLPTHRTPARKVGIFRWVVANNGEGVMIKDADGPYVCGKRSNYTLKAKLIKTADVIIWEVGREGKRSASVRVYDGDTPVDVGSVALTERQLATFNHGDVVEATFLYVSNDMRLYQPRLTKGGQVRTDKTDRECTLDQLTGFLVNKQVNIT